MSSSKKEPTNCNRVSKSGTQRLSAEINCRAVFKRCHVKQASGYALQAGDGCDNGKVEPGHICTYQGRSGNLRTGCKKYGKGLVKLYETMCADMQLKATDFCDDAFRLGIETGCPGILAADTSTARSLDVADLGLS